MPPSPRTIGILVVSALAVSAGAGAVTMLHDSPASPELTGFDAGRPQCRNTDASTGVDRFASNATQNATYYTVSGNVSVPDTGHDLSASVSRNGSHTYVLNVTSNGSDGVAAMCLARVPYTATVRLPEDADANVTLVVLHDGDRVGSVGRAGNHSTASAVATGGDQT